MNNTSTTSPPNAATNKSLSQLSPWLVSTENVGTTLLKSSKTTETPTVAKIHRKSVIITSL